MSAAPGGVSVRWLLEGIAVVAHDVCIADLTSNSAEAGVASAFFALQGRRCHGLAFAADAVARGARVVVWEGMDGAHGANGAARADAALAALADEISARGEVVVVRVPALRKLLGAIADKFFGAPSAQLKVVGITGTNGKTTTAYLLAQCLERLGTAAAYGGTLGWGRVGPGAAAPGGGPAASGGPAAGFGPLTHRGHTTPDVITVHRRLAMLRDAGVRVVAMEVSSHALDQGRVDAVRFHSAAFTNLTRDHLDYHPDMAAYGAAKARLFAMPGLEHAIVQVGDAFGRSLAGACAGRVAVTAVWVGDGAGSAGQGGAGDGLTGGVGDGAAGGARQWLRARELTMAPHGIAMMLDGSLGDCALSTRLLGRFNAENALLVLGALDALGVALAAAAAALGQCAAPPGRMELVGAGVRGRPLAVIDYAHTPDALDKALAALREHCRGALWCVFGCGGDRDPGKRPLMGAVADARADRIIVTDDNPRSEDPQAITRAILAGIRSAAVRVINDRGVAIGTALREAAAADVVLIAGKGHEDHQIYGDVQRDFSDRREALRHLEAAA